MSRSELRREQRDQQKKTKTFTLTQIQIDELKKKAVEEATDKAFMLMLVLPLEVLISEGYWLKSAKKRMPKFMDDILSLYDSYESGHLSMEEMEKDLWTYGGIKCSTK